MINKTAGFIFILVFLCYACGPSADPTGPTEEAPYVVRQAAEYDPLEAVWLIWPPVDHVEGMSNEQVLLEIIDRLAPNTPVVVTTANAELLNRAKSMVPANFQESGRNPSAIPSMQRQRRLFQFFRR